MLTRLENLPQSYSIAGVHCVPITPKGNIVLSWDEEEQLITTVGGRLEQNETIEQALSRELLEEIGLTIEESKIPLITYFWKSTNTYTILSKQILNMKKRVILSLILKPLSKCYIN